MTLSLPPEMAKEVDKLMKKEKRTKSELFREALRKYINDKRWQQIRRWGMKTAKESGLSSEADDDRLIHKHRRGPN